MFDECVGKPIMESMFQIIAASTADPEKPEFRHIVDHQKQGALDADWVPKVASEGWIVITADRGKRCGGAKLPQLCRLHGITHVMLSASLHSMASPEKVGAIMSVWSDLVKLRSEPRGSGYSLRLSTSLRVTLLRVYEPPIP
jgi:hypothetical protein